VSPATVLRTFLHSGLKKVRTWSMPRVGRLLSEELSATSASKLSMFFRAALRAMVPFAGPVLLWPLKRPIG
jgi:hypothetical protein